MVRYLCKSNVMHNKTNKLRASNALLQEIKAFFTRLFLSPEDVYTIKYYKKSKRYSRHRHELFIK